MQNAGKTPCPSPLRTLFVVLKCTFLPAQLYNTLPGWRSQVLKRWFRAVRAIIALMQRDSEDAGILRVLLLTTPRSYRLAAFRQAAARLGIEVVTGLDVPPELANQWPDALALRFHDIQGATEAVVTYARQHPVAAVLSVDDSGSLLAAAASAALGLPHNHPDAAIAARNKHLMRRMLRQGMVASPEFEAYDLADDPASIAAGLTYPVVVKPVDMNGSRGVMRANNPEELTGAINRLRRVISAAGQTGSAIYLIERYLPGVEVAVEGLLDGGNFHLLALFDKPDPLEGPFFEETIYVTPSR